MICTSKQKQDTLKLYTYSGELLGETEFFNPALTLDCGQAFRWSEAEDGSIIGTAFGRHLAVRAEDGKVFFDTSKEDFDAVWHDYFDLGRDYRSLCEGFKADEYLAKAVRAYPGIRILRQEPWEALCSFIISQNNNIPRIKGIIQRLCEAFGDDIGNGCYSFPCAQRLAELSVGDLAPLRSGFRAKYIIDAARKAASGEVDVDALSAMALDEARAELMKIKGVGPKVAECTLLYGCGKVDAFPMDVWVKRIMSEMYPAGLPHCTDGVRGIAQQYLFHWRRNLSEVDG